MTNHNHAKRTRRAPTPNTSIFLHLPLVPAGGYLAAAAAASFSSRNINKTSQNVRQTTSIPPRRACPDPWGVSLSGTYILLLAGMARKWVRSERGQTRLHDTANSLDPAPGANKYCFGLFPEEGNIEHPLIGQNIVWPCCATISLRVYTTVSSLNTNALVSDQHGLAQSTSTSRWHAFNENLKMQQQRSAAPGGERIWFEARGPTVNSPNAHLDNCIGV